MSVSLPHLVIVHVVLPLVAATLMLLFRERHRRLESIVNIVATLALAGEGDFAGHGQLPSFAAALTAPVTTHEFTIAEGAGGHCEGVGQDRLEQYVYGWLTDVLAHSDEPVHAQA